MEPTRAGLKVPFIANGRQKLKQIQPETMLSLVDVLPTILEILKIPVDIDGRSFCKLYKEMKK